MRLLFNLVTCFLCYKLSLASNTYRAGVVSSIQSDPSRYTPFIAEAAKFNVDILVLPSPEVSSFERSAIGSDNYDEFVKTLSDATKQAGLYVVTHLYENVRCQNKNELVRSNLVFDRDGSIISVYRKPLNKASNCTTGATDFTVFNTDFDVTFGLLMEEDLVLQNPEDLKGVKNFVVTGAWPTEIPYLSASYFSSSWAYVNKANVISVDGISLAKSGEVKFVDLNKNGAHALQPPVVQSKKLKGFAQEDLSYYTIRPIDIEAGGRGYKEAVCHDSFCCEFYVKASLVGTKNVNEVNYGLAAFNGVRPFGRGHNIGTQICAVYTCAGLYKRSCSIGLENNAANVKFDKITITGNFTNGNINYPIILSSGEALETTQFQFDSKSVGNTVTIELKDFANVLNFGITSRDYSKDSISPYVGEKDYKDNLDIYDYIYNEDIQEFFDYVWIRLRILIVIVSIYVLEMM